MNRDLDPEQLVADNKRLTNENRHLRQQLWDDFAKAAVVGLSSQTSYSPGFIAKRAAEIADEMIDVREARRVLQP